MRVFSKSLCAGVLALSTVALAQKPSMLVVISVDGMKPEYATHAAEHGLQLPELESFLKQGSYAEGVIGDVPTVTYPSHTTLITGVPPAIHGIENNVIFDPLNEHPGVWYWDFKYLKAQTIYMAADKAGLKTASIGWPVTIGAPVDYLIAEGMQSEKIKKPSGPAYVPADIEAQLGVTKQEGWDIDDIKTAQAAALLKKWKPTLTLIHLTDLDHQEHQHGPFSTEANAAITKIDGQIEEIEDAAREADPNYRIVIVSDHGFEKVDHSVNLNVMFRKAGLFTLGELAKKRATIASWDAEAWTAGGCSAIMLHDPNNAAVKAKVKDILEKLKADPKYHVERLLDQQEVAKAGGFPDAAYYVCFKDGYYAGGLLQGDADIVPSVKTLGTHGFDPSDVNMRSTFFAKGHNIAKGKNLKVINMLQIAPTLLKLISVQMPAAKAEPVNLK